jgi:hypothetical protein
MNMFAPIKIIANVLGMSHEETQLLMNSNKIVTIHTKGEIYLQPVQFEHTIFSDEIFLNSQIEPL